MLRARRRRDPEAVVQVALAVERLPHVRLAARDVAVGLDPPAADHLEAPLGDALADRLEQLGVALLDPLEVHDRVAGEDELRVLLHAVDRRLEGGAHLLVPLRPLPQPHRVDVRVADHVQDAGSLTPSLLGRPRVDLLDHEVQQQQVHLLDARGRGRRDDERVVGVLRGRRAVAAGEEHRRRAPLARAASQRPTTFGERPLVVNPTTTSPVPTSACTCARTPPRRSSRCRCTSPPKDRR